jgi:GT2 family glycosyltransferase
MKCVILPQCLSAPPTREETVDMEVPPLLSIVVINWNTREFLGGCLGSILSRGTCIPSEVFVVDNGSSDGSQQMVRERYPAVRLLELEKNLGFAAGNNRALRLSAGKYCLLLNSDTVVTSGAVEAVMAYLEKNEDVGIAGLQLLNADGSRQNSIANFPSLLTELFNKSLLRRLSPGKFPGKERSYAGPIDVESVIGACLFVRRKAMEQVGLLDEEYFFYLEETDWCLRVRKAGWRVIHYPGASIYHLQGKSVEGVNVRARIEYFRSRYLFFRKHLSPRACFLLKSGLVLKTAVNLLFHFLLSAATLFSVRRRRERMLLYWAILRWHIRGCPSSEGLTAA